MPQLRSLDVTASTTSKNYEHNTIVLLDDDDELQEAPRYLATKRQRSVEVAAEDGRIIEDVDIGSVAKKQRTSFIVLPGLKHPKSIYTGWSPPLAITKEWQALDELLAELWRLSDPSDAQQDYKMVSLTNFTIYRPRTSANHPLTLAPLDDLKTRVGNGAMLFDGILHVGNVRRYVQGVPFEILAIDGYGSDESSVAAKTSIQSLQGSRTNTFYLLEQPSDVYRRFYSPFVWLVDFAKHFVGYLLDKDNVCLSDFRQNFWDALKETHGQKQDFRIWHNQFGRHDFRQVVAAHFEFLWKEATDIEAQNYNHSLWGEVDQKNLDAIKPQIMVEDKTIVTPFVKACFEKLYFASCLEVRTSSTQVAELRRQRAVTMRLATASDLSSAIRPWPTTPPVNIQVGDIVGIPADADSKWKSTTAATWYAYVQGIRPGGRGKYLDLIWLFRHSDTSCGKMHYPFINELFFSDHCNCEDNKGSSARVYLEDVLEKLEVVFCQIPAEAEGKPFIRQTYYNSDAAFRTFQKRDLSCTCRSSDCDYTKFKQTHPPGSTVLAKIHGCTRLEVVEIRQIEDPKHVFVRRLMRRKEAYGDLSARANELVYTRRTFVIRMTQVVRKCHVRAFPLEQARKGLILAPYAYNGAGDCWIVTGQEHGDQKKPSYNQGFEPASHSSNASEELRPLNGLGLFSGGGSFERGLEEGGGVKFKWGVDWDKNALHTYHANLRDPKDAQLFLGSVNDYHARALAGDDSSVIASVGEVQFIAAGSPCQGFSRVQQNKLSEQSLRNASMVASVATSVDIYHPERGLLENVHGMVMGLGAEEQNVFQQLVCCLVAMGYQVEQFNVDAWSSGSPQSRSRIFVSFTAPGLTPLSAPVESHSHPMNANRRRLGTGANGLPFGVREIGQATAFPFTTAGEATSDLPDIEDGSVGTCIRFPDHRLAARQKEWSRLVIKHIPLFPKCMSWRRTADMKLSPLPPQLQRECARQSNLWMGASNKAYTRNDPDGVFPTIITTPNLECAMNGKYLHWRQHRALTVMEARRAQSYPDHEVLIGSTAKQWKIVGNSVARTVAVTFGMSLRQAWLGDVSLDLPQRLEPSEMPVVTEVISAAAEAVPVKEEHMAEVTKSTTITIAANNDEEEDLIILGSPDEPSTAFLTPLTTTHKVSRMVSTPRTTPVVDKRVSTHLKTPVTPIYQPTAPSRTGSTRSSARLSGTPAHFKRHLLDSNAGSGGRSGGSEPLADRMDSTSDSESNVLSRHRAALAYKNAPGSTNVSSRASLDLRNEAGSSTKRRGNGLYVQRERRRSNSSSEALDHPTESGKSVQQNDRKAGSYLVPPHGARPSNVLDLFTPPLSITASPKPQGRETAKSSARSPTRDDVGTKEQKQRHQQHVEDTLASLWTGM